MRKVYMMPTPADAANDQTNSINQIVVRLQKALPAHGWEITSNRAEADLTAGHAGQTTDGGYVDIAHCHGLYATSIPSQTNGWHWLANRHVIDNVRGAKAVTAPSQWVADMLRRDMHIDPHVVGWAIDPDEFEPGTNRGYILWNKTRTDGVCSPEPLNKLAKLAPGHQFLTTFGENLPNVRAVGRVPFDHMRQMVRDAAVYLATTKETFGIGTLEAMAAGVPVLGFRHGGTVDIVKHGVNGFLAMPGDYDGLLAGLEYCLAHREILGFNARAAARAYTWDRVAAQFAAIYDRVVTPRTGPKVSVVIPCHNYGRYLPTAVNSVMAQEASFDFELIIVDDRSTDGSYEVAERLSIEAHESGNAKTIIYCEETPGPDNKPAGVAEARNWGIESAEGEYIVCLDADDKLGDPRFLQTLADALDRNPTLGIAFTGLQMMTAEGELGNVADWPNGYNYELQLAGRNQVPTCCMFRREAWERAGGYRKKYTPAEDAELWLRIGALGYRAEQVTREGWFVYRLHGDSLSAAVRTGQKVEPNWRDKHWIESGQRPFAADGDCRSWSWPVRNYDRPRVSVIIPVGPYHTEHFREAVDSIEAQTDPYWECIVVNDSGEDLNLRGMPFVREIRTRGGLGASKARNMGIEAAEGQFITFLDADDEFSPKFLELTLRHYAIHGRYVYTDWLSVTKTGEIEIHETPEFDPGLVFKQTSLHSINVLIRAVDLRKVGGFDETMTTWEDVDLFMKLAAAGICGVRLANPLIAYRYQSGQLRERGEIIKPALLNLLRGRYSEYIDGGKIPVCCGTVKKGKNGGADGNDAAALASAGSDHDMVRVLYNGPMATHDVIGGITKQRYGRRERGDVFFVYAEDQAASPELYAPIADLSADDETILPEAPVLVEGA